MKMPHFDGIKGAHRQRSYINRLDIIIINNKEKTCIKADAAITADGNVTEKEGERKLKSKGLYW